MPVQLLDLLPLDPDHPVRLSNICKQLAQNGLINWEVIKTLNGVAGGLGRIAAFGVDVMEGKAQPPIAISISDQSINVHGSSNVQIENQNVLKNAELDMRKIMSAIDASNATTQAKDEAKSLLSKLSGNATFASIIGAIVAMASPAH